MTSRRQFIAGLAAWISAPAWARAADAGMQTGIQLAASWQSGNAYQTGVLARAASGEALTISAAIDVPTRAHGLLLERDGTIITVARRPGNWLLRWTREGKPLAWHWIEPNRAFAGHVLVSADGSTLYTTEIDLETGSGMIGVRDAASLEKHEEWPTRGIDPHQLVWDVTHPGSLIVANGGVPTRPETGRIKHNLDHMDSSLVRLDAKTGELLGQWRLEDSRLSLRHLAWNISVRNQPVLGIALQAEHNTTEQKSAAPVLALFDGEKLRTVSTPHKLAGYGGDIATRGSSLAVSCPRVNSIEIFDVRGTWRGHLSLPEACALAPAAQTIVAGGRHQAIGLQMTDSDHANEMTIPAFRLDNHWIAI
jgi:hypothetical protein